MLQLVLPSVVSVADARVEREALSARAYSHVESNTGKDCARVHKADCALCQHLTTPAARPAKAAPPVYVVGCDLPSALSEPARVVTRASRASLPRAPPSA